MSEGVTQTNIGKLAIASLTLSVLINLLLWGYAMNYSATLPVYPSNIINMMSDKAPTNYVCEKGDETCNQELQNVPAEATGQIDKTQQLINVIAIIGGMLAIIFMTPIFPTILTVKLIPLITNAWVMGIIGIFTTMWTILNVYLIYMLLFKKWWKNVWTNRKPNTEHRPTRTRSINNIHSTKHRHSIPSSKRHKNNGNSNDNNKHNDGNSVLRRIQRKHILPTSSNNANNIPNTTRRRTITEDKRKMKKQYLIKVSTELYIYLKKTGEKKYGRGLSMPYYLYKMAKEVNNGRRH